MSSSTHKLTASLLAAEEETLNARDEIELQASTHNTNSEDKTTTNNKNDCTLNMTSTLPTPTSSVATTQSARNSSERSLPLRSYSKWSPSEQGATLVWRDLCVYTTGQGGEGGSSASGLQNMKRIINNSTGAVQPGNLMALMGSR